MVTKKYRLSGMTCPNCAMRIEALEDALPGVERISASYRTATMVIAYDETKTGEREIVAALLRLGYTAEVMLQA